MKYVPRAYHTEAMVQKCLFMSHVKKHCVTNSNTKWLWRLGNLHESGGTDSPQDMTIGFMIFFMMMQKWYTYSRNHTSNFGILIFSQTMGRGRILSLDAGLWLHLPVSSEIRRGNDQHSTVYWTAEPEWSKGEVKFQVVVFSIWGIIRMSQSPASFPVISFSPSPLVLLTCTLKKYETLGLHWCFLKMD